MKISAVYIAKNEENNIARSLDSIKDAVDELVLVDTGSTDNTVEIFKSYGGQVFYRQWDDDFSAPRNLALSKANGDWIIILDADESFSTDTRNNIKAVLQSCSPSAKGLLLHMVNYDGDTKKQLDEFYTLRIVRNVPGLNYKGKIHEMLYIGDEAFYDAQRVSKELLSIDHTGYSTSISTEKNQRNLRLMEAAIAAGEPEARYYTSLYETHGALGNTEKSLYYAKLDVERGRQPVTYASRSYRGLLQYYAEDSSIAGKLQRLKLAEKAIKDFPELPDFHAEYSEALYQLGCYSKALEEINQALSIYADYDGLEPCLLTDKMIPIMEQRKKEMEELAAINPNIKISACVIVKNEEKNILSWLKNVSAFADEIIINDTGSTDNTKAIITEFSEKNPAIPMILLESDWQENFSLAKNQCLAEAAGDWIVFTDADEVFVNPELVRGYLSYCHRGKSLQAILVPMENIDIDNDNKVINCFNSLRIFRNLLGLHYEGRIHENIVIGETDLADINTQIADKCLLINHTGYSSNISREKAQRNISLLLKDIQDGQDIRKIYRYLAECYYMLNDYQRALDNALLATQSTYQPIGQQGDMYWLALNAMEKLEYSLEDKLVIADTGINLFSELPDFYARRGMILTEKEDYHGAIADFQQSLELLEEYNRQTAPINSSNIMSILHELYADLGLCLYKLGELQPAEAMFKTALTLNKWTEKAICGWADMYHGRVDKSFLIDLEELYMGINDYQGLLGNVFSSNGFVELAEYFCGKNQKTYMDVKAYPWIYNRSMKEMAEILPYLYVCLLEKYHEEYAMILPVRLADIVKYIHGLVDEEAIKGHYEEYKTFMKEVFMLASPVTVEKYINMLSLVSRDEAEVEQHIIEVAGILLSCDKAEQALDLYKLIPMDSEKVNEGFWQQVGICFYNLGGYDTAQECLERSTKDYKTATYIKWCQEAMNNGH